MHKLPRKESETVEFKISFETEAAITLSAFANTRGGTVYIGIEDGGAIAGCTIGKETLPQWINQIKMSTFPSLIPDVAVQQYKEKTVVALTIKEFPIKPVSCKGKYYKRIGASNHLMATGEVVDHHLKSFNRSWDYAIDSNHSIDEVSLEKVELFIERANRHRETTINDTGLDVLKKYELIRNGNITHACFLLFMKGESSLSTIELGRFQTETIIKDSARIKGDILGQVDTILDYIKKHINRTVQITGNPERTDKWEYPLDALREIVINAIVHRDYSSASDSIIKIFDHHICIYNPGKLPAGLTIKRLLSGDYLSTPRNRQIADIFKDAGLIEKYGSGIRRIRESFIKASSREPRFEEIGEGFMVTIFPFTPQKTPQKKSSESGPGAAILAYIKKNPAATRNDIATALGYSSETVKEYLEKLKQTGELTRTGGRKIGQWVVKG